MTQSRTLDLGWAVHQESSAVAYGAKAHDADVICLGSIGPRHVDLDHRVRTLHSHAQHRVFVYDAGPCGSWLYRYLRKTGDVCRGVAPALIPQTAGERVKTDRRDAIHLARFMRAGDLTPVYVPTVEEEALRDRWRAREDASAALKAATCRLHAFLLRHASR
jgi:transposase